MTQTQTEASLPKHSLPMVLTVVEAASVERLSPSFVRIELAGPELADFGVEDANLYDQRIKLVFPPEGGDLPSFEGADESWFGTWLQVPVEERGHMRTYTVREVRGEGADTRVVVDFVLHGADGHGEPGPGSAWAAAAAPGDRVVLLGPSRGLEFGGIEYIPGRATSVLIVADETAVPAACAILEQTAADGDSAPGHAFLEVPEEADVCDVVVPEGWQVTWLPRGVDAESGAELIPAVRGHFGLDGPVEIAPESAVDPDLWETPMYSSSGDDVPAAAPSEGCYAWIAGESRVVTTLRRALVREAEMDRSQVSFMGYWRRGVAMKS